jgi:hypothetical protein
MTTSNINAVILQLMQICSNTVGQDISQINGFSKRKIGNIANQIDIVSFGISNGQINEFNRESNINYIIQLIDEFIQELNIKNIDMLSKLITSLNEYCYLMITKSTDSYTNESTNTRIFIN